jgi:hypothetical protein
MELRGAIRRLPLAGAAVAGAAVGHSIAYLAGIIAVVGVVVGILGLAVGVAGFRRRA